MYRIFVAGHEPVTRRDLREMIEGLGGPYVLCGEAPDGETALSIMQEMMPDILLADIRLPDGSGLIRQAGEMLPWLKTVTVIGRGDPEYAEKDAAPGEDLYLPRPVRQEELECVIGEAARRIDTEKAAGGTVPAGVKDEEAPGALRREFLSGLLYDAPDPGGLIEKARPLKMDIVSSRCLAALFSFDSPVADPLILKRTVEKTLEGEEHALYLFNTPVRMTLMACGSDSGALNEKVYHLISVLRHELREICPVITVVIGRQAARPGSVSESFRAAEFLMCSVKNICAGKVINMNDAFPEQAYPLSAPFDEAFRQKLRYASPEDVPALLDGFMRSPAGERFSSMLVRCHALYSVIDTALFLSSGNEAAGAGEKMMEEIGGRVDLMAAASSREGFCAAAEEILKYALRARDERAKGGEGVRHLIARAEEYARENFTDPHISLLSTARHVGMSAAYFSTVFSQTTGQSFIAFLTGLRLGRARELLAHTDEKLSDIAMDIGCSDPGYFSHVFRKTVGMTPGEYRARRSGQ